MCTIKRFILEKSGGNAIGELIDFKDQAIYLLGLISFIFFSYSSHDRRRINEI